MQCDAAQIDLVEMLTGERRSTRKCGKGRKRLDPAKSAESQATASAGSILASLSINVITGDSAARAILSDISPDGDAKELLQSIPAEVRNGGWLIAQVWKAITEKAASLAPLSARNWDSHYRLRVFARFICESQDAGRSWELQQAQERISGALERKGRRRAKIQAAPESA